MKTLEKRENCEKLEKNNGCSYNLKLLISQLSFMISFKTWYLIKANVIFLYSVS